MSKSLFYYIPKLLKNVSSCYITRDAKRYMDQIILVITRQIIITCINLLSVTNKRVLNIRALVNASRLVLSGELLTNALEEGDTHVKLETNKDVRSSLIFSPSFFRNVVQDQIPQHLKISSKFPVFIASMMEYICVEILDLSSIQARKRNHVKITPRDIFLSIHYDVELLTLYKQCHIVMLGCGVVPRNDESDKESRCLQSSTHLLLPRASFNTMIRSICDIKISKSAATFLQQYIEYFIIHLLQNTENMCKSIEKARITEDDLLYMYNNI